MVITIVCDVLGAPNNGTSIAAYNLINFLRSKGHKVKVLCPDESKRGEEDYFILPTLNFGIFNMYVEKNGVSLAKKDLAIVAAAIDGSDIVHCMQPFSAGHIAALYAHEHNIPLTAGFHTQAENILSHLFLMNSKSAAKIAYDTMWKKLYCYCDGIHYPTEFIKDYVKRYGIKAPKEFVISNGVNSTFYKRDNLKRPEEFKDKYVILMIGRYSKEKNQMLLLKAVAKSKYKDNIQIILAGGGPQEKELKKFAQKHLTLQPIMEMYSRDELVEIINFTDLYVHTSEVEIEAISCLEAISCGVVPCISDSQRSATSKFALVPESHFKNNNAKDLQNKIEWWFEHPKEKNELSKRYIEFAKQFDFDSCMQRMEDMFLDVLKDYGKKEK